MEYDKIAQQLRMDRQTWLTNANYNYELFYKDVDGTKSQFSKDNLDAIKNTYNIPISINVVYPTIDQMVAFLAGGKPSVRIMPVGPADKDKAYKLQEIWSAIWYRSDSIQKNKFALLDTMVTGSGWLMPEASTFYNRSPLGVTINHIPYDIVFPDRRARNWDYSDAEYMMISKELSLEKIKKVFGIDDERLKSILGINTNGNIPFDMDARNVNEIYIKEYVDNNYIGRDGKISKERRSLNDVQITKDIVIRRITTIDDTKDILNEMWMPIHEYPMIHLPCIWNSNPKKGLQTYSMVHQISDCQDGINKTTAHSLLNAQLHGHVKMMAPKGSIDKEEFKLFASSPMHLLEYELEVVNGHPVPPERMQASPLPSAHYELSGWLIKMVELVTGMYSVMQGSPYEAPSTVGGTQSLQAYGSQRIKDKAGTNDVAYSKLCHNTISMAVFYNDPKKEYRFISDDSEEGREEQWRTVKLGDDMPNINDYDVVAIPSPSTPTSRMLATQVLTQIAQQVGDPAIVTEVLQQTLKLLDLPEGDKISKRIDTIKVLQQQLSDSAEQINRMTQQLDNTVKSNEALMVKMRVMEQTNVIENKAIRQQAELENHIELAKQEVTLKKDHVLDKIENKEKEHEETKKSIEIN